MDKECLDMTEKCLRDNCTCDICLNDELDEIFAAECLWQDELSDIDEFKIAARETRR